MKRLWTMILCLALTLSMIGCGSAKTKNEESSKGAVSNADAVITVGYINQDGGQRIDALLKWYRTQKDVPQMKVVTYKTSQELEQALETEGQPDVILLDKYTSAIDVSPFEWIRDEKLAGLSEYLKEETSFDASNYISGALEAGRYGDEQYILPLSVSNQYWLVNEGEFQSGSFSSLMGEYTVNILLDAMIADLQLHEGEEGYYTQFPVGFNICSRYQWLYECLEQTGALHVDREAKQVTVDETLFQQVLKYYRYTMASVDPLFMGTANTQSLSAADLESCSTAFVFNDNAAFSARYMSSAGHQLMNQSVRLLSLETKEGGYCFNVDVMGMVTAASEQPYAAVTFLRTLMDIPHTEWEMVSMRDAITTMSPVNQNEALALLESLQTLSGGQFKIQGSVFDREPLPTDLAEDLTDLVTKAERAYIVDDDVCEILRTYLSDYIGGQSDQLDGLAEKIKTAIEAMA